MRFPVVEDEQRIAASDSGLGTPAGHLPHIFERFYQVDPARSRGTVVSLGGGAGLGLAIARELTRAHGDEIATDSLPGKGSTFTVNLPLE